jgi:hypothetical protein
VSKAVVTFTGDLFPSRIKLYLKIAIASIPAKALVLIFINLLSSLSALWRDARRYRVCNSRRLLTSQRRHAPVRCIPRHQAAESFGHACATARPAFIRFLNVIDARWAYGSVRLPGGALFVLTRRRILPLSFFTATSSLGFLDKFFQRHRELVGARTSAVCLFCKFFKLAAIDIRWTDCFHLSICPRKVVESFRGFVAACSR